MNVFHCYFLMNSFTVHVKKLLQKTTKKQLQWVEAFLLLLGYQPQPYNLKRLVSKKVELVSFCTPLLHFHVIKMQEQNLIGNAFVFSNSLLFIMGSSVYLGTNYLVHWFKCIGNSDCPLCFFLVQLLLEQCLSFPWEGSRALRTQDKSVPDQNPKLSPPWPCPRMPCQTPRASQSLPQRCHSRADLFSLQPNPVASGLFHQPCGPLDSCSYPQGGADAWGRSCPWLSLGVLLLSEVVHHS